MLDCPESDQNYKTNEEIMAIWQWLHKREQCIRAVELRAWRSRSQTDRQTDRQTDHICSNMRHHDVWRPQCSQYLTKNSIFMLQSWESDNKQSCHRPRHRRHNWAQPGIWTNRITARFLQFYYKTVITQLLPSVLWHCRLGVRKSIWPVKVSLMKCWCGCLSGVRCRFFAYSPADAIAIPKPHHLLPHLNPDSFYLSGTGLPEISWKETVKRV